MLFQTSRQVGRIPIILIVGECLASATQVLNMLLQDESLVHSVVIRLDQGEDEAELVSAPLSAPLSASVSVSAPAPAPAPAPISRHRTIRLPRPLRADTVAEESCLCCGMHSALGDTLRTLFFQALSDRTQALDRVVIVTDTIDAQQLAHTLKHTPFLGQRYVHQMTFSVMTSPQVHVNGFDLRQVSSQTDLQTDLPTGPVPGGSQEYLVILGPVVRQGRAAQPSGDSAQRDSHDQNSFLKRLKMFEGMR